jgi:hypothetical protein
MVAGLGIPKQRKPPPNVGCLRVLPTVGGSIGL